MKAWLILEGSKTVAGGKRSATTGLRQSTQNASRRDARTRDRLSSLQDEGACFENRPVVSLRSPPATFYYPFGIRLRSSVLVLTTAFLFLSICSPTVNAADKARPKDITFDDIKFDIKKDGKFKREMLTKKIEDLSGSSIKIRGYILPSFQQKGIKQFVLVRDNMECCFGPGAALYDCILVEMAPGKSASFTVRPVSVEGKFVISEFIGPDGKHLAIYRMVGKEVK